MYGHIRIAFVSSIVFGDSQLTLSRLSLPSDPDSFLSFSFLSVPRVAMVCIPFPIISLLFFRSWLFPSLLFPSLKFRLSKTPCHPTLKKSFTALTNTWVSGKRESATRGACLSCARVRFHCVFLNLSCPGYNVPLSWRPESSQTKVPNTPCIHRRLQWPRGGFMPKFQRAFVFTRRGRPNISSNNAINPPQLYRSRTDWLPRFQSGISHGIAYSQVCFGSCGDYPHKLRTCWSMHWRLHAFGSQIWRRYLVADFCMTPWHA